jgi:XTP/dITP diphosphohydrolase
LTEKRLLVASTNCGKVREIKTFLRGLGLHIESLTDFPEFGTFEEIGKTFEENSLGKSLYYSEKYPGLVLAEDSGLEVEVLGGQPGVFSARFAGKGASDTQNIQKLLRLLAGLPRSKRKARFVCVASLASKGKLLKTFRGEVRGFILEKPDGKKGFGYDPIFYYPPLKKTFAQLRIAEKNRVSHRGRALKKVRKFLTRYLQTAEGKNKSESRWSAAWRSTLFD